MKLAIITALPESTVTLAEYGFHLVKNLKNHPEVTELVVLTDEAGARNTVLQDLPGCPVTLKACWSFNDWRNTLKIHKSLQEVRPDAVIYNLQFMKFGDRKIPAALGLLSPMITRLRGIPTTTLLHNIMETVDLEQAGFTASKLKASVFRFIGNVLTRILLKSDVLVLTMSKYLDILEKKFGARNITQIPHGSFETPPQPDFEIPEGPKRILAFGKFGTYKKVETLLEASVILRTVHNQEVSVVIAGTDSPNTPGYLKDVAERYDWIPDVNFTGYVAEEDVPELFNSSTMVVFPYTSTTGSSGVLHQAGSYGKAAVLPNIGDLGLLVQEEGYDGEFFTPENSESLAQAIENLLRFPDRRKQLARNNYEAACSLPMSEIADRYVQLSKALIKGRKPLDWRHQEEFIAQRDPQPQD